MEGETTDCKMLLHGKVCLTGLCYTT